VEAAGEDSWLILLESNRNRLVNNHPMSWMGVVDSSGECLHFDGGDTALAYMAVRSEALVYKGSGF
jgi:hypothetical protein